MKVALALVAVVALAAPAHAGEMYRWIDGAAVVYSDQPPQDGVTLSAMPGADPLPVVTAPEMPPAAAAVAAAGVRSRADVIVSTAPATVDEILELSGMRPQLPGIARSLAAEYLPRPGQLDERDGVRIAQIAARHFAPERMFTAIRDDFRRRVDATQLNAMAAWFRSPLGSKVTGLEVAASHPDAAPKVAAFAADLKTSPPTPARRELAERLDWVAGTTEETTELVLAIAGSVARAVAAAAPAERRARVGLVDRRVEEMRGQIANVIGDNVRTQMLYVYGPLTDAELKAYVDFLASPAGRAYGRIAHGALLRVVRDAAERTALEILRAVPAERWAAVQRTSGTTPSR